MPGRRRPASPAPGRKPGRRRVLAVAAAVMTAVSSAWLPRTAPAELVWQQREAHFEGTAAWPLVLEARFPFRNAGQEPVEVLAVRPSCGCLGTELSRRRLAPGESGELVARFRVGERTGRLERRVEVFTSDRPASGPTTLTLVAVVPELLRMRPAFVSWQPGDSAAEPRVITVEAPAAAVPLRSVEAAAADPGWVRSAVRTVAAGRRYEVSVWPGPAARSGVVKVEIACRFQPPPGTSGAAPQPRVLHAYATFRAGPLAATAAAAR